MAVPVLLYAELALSAALPPLPRRSLALRSLKTSDERKAIPEMNVSTVRTHSMNTCTLLPRMPGSSHR